MKVTRCGRNEVLVITGCCVSDYKFVRPRSFALALPGQQLHRLPSQTMSMRVETNNVVTKNGAPISVAGVFQIKIDPHQEDLLKLACERFLGKSEAEIKSDVSECVERYQRSVMGTFTPEDVVDIRKTISQAVFEAASCETVVFGVTVVSYVLKDYMDEEHYFVNMMNKRRAEKAAAEKAAAEAVETTAAAAAVVSEETEPEKLTGGLVDRTEMQRHLEEMKLAVEREAQEVMEEELREEKEDRQTEDAAEEGRTAEEVVEKKEN